jgi:hypothetical protein
MARRTPGSSSEDSRAAAHLLEAYIGERGGDSGGDSGEGGGGGSG